MRGSQPESVYRDLRGGNNHQSAGEHSQRERVVSDPSVRLKRWRRTMRHTLGTIAEKLGGRVLGDASVSLSGIASVSSAAAGSLVFIEDANNLERALASPGAAIIVGAFAANAAATKPLLICAHPRLAFARAAELLHESDGRLKTIHASAIVAPSAHIGGNVAIGPRAVIGERVSIGDESTV